VQNHNLNQQYEGEAHHNANQDFSNTDFQ